MPYNNEKEKFPSVEISLFCITLALYMQFHDVVVHEETIANIVISGIDNFKSHVTIEIDRRVGTIDKEFDNDVAIAL